MQLSRRIPLTLGSIMACLLICLAFTGQALAFREHPRITVTPKHIYTDTNGCGSVRISGTGFQPSTQSHPNRAELDVSDSQGGAYFQDTGTSSTEVPVEANGQFSAVKTVCEATLVPGDTFTICGYDEDPGVDSNCVNVRAS